MSVAESVASWIWVGGFVPLLTLVPLLYPDGRLPGPRWRPWIATSVAGMVLLASGSATYPGVSRSCSSSAALSRWCPAASPGSPRSWSDGGVLRAGAPPGCGVAGDRGRAGRRHAAPAAAVLAGGRPDPGARGRAGAGGHRRRGDPAPALRPRPRRVPGDRRAEPRRVPGRLLRQPVPDRFRRAARRPHRRRGHRGRRVRAAAPPARRPVEPGRRPDVLRRPRRPRAGPRGHRHRAARGSTSPRRPLGSAQWSSSRCGSAPQPPCRRGSDGAPSRWPVAGRAGDPPADAAPRRGRRDAPRHRPPGETSVPPATPSCWPSSATRSPRPSPHCGSPTGSSTAGPRS